MFNHRYLRVQFVFIKIAWYCVYGHFFLEYFVMSYVDCNFMSVSLKIDFVKLCECFSNRQLCMDQFEWTLSGRVNCKEDQEETSAEETDEATTVPMIKLEPAITSYYSMTAPVCSTAVEISPEHSVKNRTKTVIVDMRYRFLAKQLRVWDSKSQNYITYNTATVLDYIADEVRDLVTKRLISSSDLDNYK